MEKPAFTRVNLNDVRVIMVITHVLVVELLCQVVMGWIPLLKCPLSSACGWLWLHPVMPDIKYRCFPRIWLHGHLPGTRKRPGVAVEGPGVCQARA
jgi:hypothetical protein